MEIIEVIYMHPGRISVCKAIKQDNPEEELAIKEIWFETSKEATVLIQEALTMAQVSHPNIISIKDIESTDKSIKIITAYYPEGDLDKEMKRRQQLGEFWAEEDLWNHLRDLVSAFEYLQRGEIAHRDIKPQNILLSGLKLIVCDLGCAIKDYSEQYKTLLGTPLYLSPILRRSFHEQQVNRRSTRVLHNLYKSDVFSLGLVFLAIASLKSVQDLAIINNLEQLIQKRIRKLNYSEEFKDILRWMLAVEEWERPDFRELNKFLSKKNVDTPQVSHVITEKNSLKEQERFLCFYCLENPSVLLECGHHNFCQSCSLLPKMIEEMNLRDIVYCPYCLYFIELSQNNAYYN